MKELKRNEEGVSPVIATILMVAITVVLAATLYMMVGDIGGGGDTPVAGTMTYNADRSAPAEGNATFNLNMNTPSSTDLGNVKITLLDANGNSVGSINGDEIDGTDDIDDFNVTIVHIGTEEGNIGGGDRIQISDSDGETDINDWELIVSIDGYSGTLSAVID